MSYTYANNQVIDQHTGGQSASKYFYINDRLGSVRQVIDMYGSVKRNYTYSPFGQLLESGTAMNRLGRFIWRKLIGLIGDSYLL